MLFSGVATTCSRRENLVNRKELFPSLVKRALTQAMQRCVCGIVRLLLIQDMLNSAELTTHIKQPSGKDECIIISRSANEKCFVDGVEQVVDARKRVGLLLQLNKSPPSNSVIVMDNAPCHLTKTEKVSRTRTSKQKRGSAVCDTKMQRDGERQLL